jgi:hypothetical protein
VDRVKLFRDAVAWAGCRFQLAEALGLPRQAVYQWRQGVPRHHVYRLTALMRSPWVPYNEIRPTQRKPLPRRRKTP